MSLMNLQEFLHHIKQSPQVATETVIYRYHKKYGLEFLLIKRPKDDPYYANQWHVAGTLLRNRESLSATFERLEREELGVLFKKNPCFVFFLNKPREQRCHTVPLVHIAKILKKTKAGHFFPAGKLPKNLIHYHREMLRIAKIIIENREKRQG